MKLILGNRNYSSWSMRGWLALRKAQLAFEEQLISMIHRDFHSTIMAMGSAGKVPFIIHNHTVIWDSLAIIEYASEQGNSLWPADPKQRAIARSACAEMHSGYQALRTAMPMNCRATHRCIATTAALSKDLNRIQTLWIDLLTASGGPFLMGPVGAVDVMFAPVVSRFSTYNVELEDLCHRYCNTLLADPDVSNWYTMALAESQIIDKMEVGKS